MKIEKDGLRVDAYRQWWNSETVYVQLLDRPDLPHAYGQGPTIEQAFVSLKLMMRVMKKKNEQSKTERKA